MTSTRRTLIASILICVALGAAINVGVAWGFGWAYGMHDMPRPARADTMSPATIAQRDTWFVSRKTCPGALEITSAARAPRRAGTTVSTEPEALIPAWARDWVTEEGIRTQPLTRTSARGWPLVCLFGVERISFQPNEYSWAIPLKSTRRSVDACYGWTTSNILPLRPIPINFAINSIMYAAIPWLLVHTTLRMRQRRRMRRGLCVHCSYPAGPSPICVECGCPMMPPRRPSIDR